MPCMSSDEAIGLAFLFPVDWRLQSAVGCCRRPEVLLISSALPLEVRYFLEDFISPRSGRRFSFRPPGTSGSCGCGERLGWNSRPACRWRLGEYVPTSLVAGEKKKTSCFSGSVQTGASGSTGTTLVVDQHPSSGSAQLGHNPSGAAGGRGPIRFELTIRASRRRGGTVHVTDALLQLRYHGGRGARAPRERLLARHVGRLRPRRKISGAGQEIDTTDTWLALDPGIGGIEPRAQKGASGCVPRSAPCRMALD